MAETNESPGSGGGDKGRKRSATAVLGNGPVLAAGLMAAGGFLFAGFGLAHVVTDDGGVVAALGKDSPAASAPADGSTGGSGSGESDDTAARDGEVTVTLPDTDHNGVADALEGQDGGDGRGPGGSHGGSSGRGDEDGSSSGSSSQEGSSDSGESSGTKTKVYIIEKGDTLSEISADTGVPIGTLVKTNDIEDPNLIYAGSALLIPPRP